MKLPYFFICLLLVSSTCNFQNNGESNSSNQTGSSPLFLELFTTISFDTLHVYSPNIKPGGNKYMGQEIHSMFYKYFSFDKGLISTFKFGGQIFGCFKFKISELYTGLVIRRPGQYSETSLCLYIWDNRKEQIINQIELADVIIDGSWILVKDGWLIDLNGDGLFDIVTRQKEWWEEDVAVTLDNPKGIGATHTTDTIQVYMARDTDFINSNYSIDSASFKLFNWEK